MIDFVQDKNGNVIADESTANHFQDILLTKKGDHKFSPFIGADVYSALHQSNNKITRKKNELLVELKQDGAKVKSVQATGTNDNINWRIDASY